MSAMRFDRVQASFARSPVHPRFFDRFYEVFIASHPAIQPMFANTDMTKQHQLLRHGLMSALRFAQSEKNLMAKVCIDRIRESHSRKQLAISPDLYPFWPDSLVKAVAECDPAFDAALEREWRDVLQPVIDYIKGGY